MAEAGKGSKKEFPNGQLVLVTGGGGFLGQVVVTQLLKAGYRVRSFSRSDHPPIRKLGAETVLGDLADPKAVLKACKGCDIVFHTAAKADIWGKYQDFYSTNVTGTENIIAACKKNKVGRLVFTSSASVVFDAGDIEGGDEKLPYPETPRSNYCSTKAEAERLVLKANSKALRTVSLRPHLIWGPGDTQIIPRIIERARSGRLVIIGDGKNKVDITYIDNAARAHLNAAKALVENPKCSGRAYFISNGEPVNVWDFINRILKMSGIPQLKKSLPRGPAMFIAFINEIPYVVLPLKGQPRLNRFLVEELTTSHWFDISAAKKELGYEPTVTIEEGLTRLKASFKKGGKK